MKEVTVIDADERHFFINFKELFRYRDLIWVFAYRDFKVRYAQSALGVLWSLIQPLLTMLILVFTFRYAAKIPTPNEIPYPAFVIIGLLGWSYFSFVFGQVAISIINQAGLISKVYFPRLVIPLAKVCVGLIDFVIVFFLSIAVLLVFQVVPSINFWAFPLFVLMNILVSSGLGILFCSITIQYRDLHHIVPFVIQIGLYASPVGYSASLIPEQWRTLYFINPMAGVIEGMRWSILGIGEPTIGWAISGAVGLFIFILGVILFTNSEDKMVDLL